MNKTEENEIEKQKNRDSEIMFFLGAGASVRAGVPDTKKFVDGFKKYVEKEEDKEKIDALNWILSILENSERIKKLRELDVELLLEILNSLNNREKDALFLFYDEHISDNYMKIKNNDAPIVLSKLERSRDLVIIKESAEFRDVKNYRKALLSLEEDLRRFIREKTIVDEERITYLEPLKDFITEYGSLDIFSVNYDTCIEQLCKRYDYEYTDGFELYWKSGLFDEDKYHVKYYKLHGSVMWYLTDRNTYVKIPITSKEKEKIELITGETAENLIVYPVESKWLYSEPLSELNHILRKKLEKVEVCIVVGYSFRDEDIKRIFFESAKKNRALVLYLVDPHAGEIYDKKLKFSDRDKEIPSSLEGRVICLNYPIENVLGDYYLYQSLKKLSDIKQLYRSADKERREGVGYGHMGELEGCVLKCIGIEYISRAEDILKKELNITPPEGIRDAPLFVGNNRDYSDKFRLYYTLGVYPLYSGHYKRAKKYFKEFRDILRESLEVGKEYFELWNEFHLIKKSQGNEDEIKQKKGEIQQRIGEIADKYEHLPFYKWVNYNSSWGRYLHDFTEFLYHQQKLRSNEGKEKDKFDKKLDIIFSKIIANCEAMRECLEIPHRHDRYEDSDVIDISGSNVEVDRKLDSEKKLEEIIGSIDILIAELMKKSELHRFEKLNAFEKVKEMARSGEGG